jgi:hypothetical protein
MGDTDGRRENRGIVNKGGAGGIWFLGFVGALVYYLHTHSGTFWLVLLAIMKAVVWPTLLVYHLLTLTA